MTLVTHTVTSVISTASKSDFFSEHPWIIQVLLGQLSLLGALATVYFTARSAQAQIRASDERAAREREDASKMAKERVESKRRALSAVLRRASSRCKGLRMDFEEDGTPELHIGSGTYERHFDSIERMLSLFEADVDLMTEQSMFALQTGLLQVYLEKDALREIERTYPNMLDRRAAAREIAQHFAISEKVFIDAAEHNDGTLKQTIDMAVLRLSLGLDLQ